MMETKQVSKTLDFNPTLMQLITKNNSEHILAVEV